MFLYFMNPKVTDGATMSTVRRGIKWALANDVKGYPVVPTNDPKNAKGLDNILGIAYPISSIMKRFSDLKLSDIQDNHDEECRTIDGLKKAMIRAYPDFDEDEIVVLFKYTYRSL